MGEERPWGGLHASAPRGGEVEGGRRSGAGAAAGQGLRSPPATGRQRAGAGAARAAAAGAAFPASREARGARAESAGRGAAGPRPRPGPPRPCRRAFQTPPSPGETRAPHPTPDLPGPHPRHRPFSGRDPLRAPVSSCPPAIPAPASPCECARVQALGDSLPPPSRDHLWLPSPGPAAQTWQPCGGGGPRYKGPEAARAETRDVARPLGRPQLQVRAVPQPNPLVWWEWAGVAHQFSVWVVRTPTGDFFLFV